MREKSIYVSCTYCGVPVFTIAWRQKNLKKRFCSREHFISWSKENAFRFECKVCSKIVLTQPSQMKYRNRRACSNKCSLVLRKAYTLEKREKLRYTKHQLDRLARYSPEAAIWRKAVFERDNYTCQICSARNGKGVGDIRLEADHIKPWAYFPELRFDINNGRTLCRPCHDTTKKSYQEMRRIYALARA